MPKNGISRLAGELNRLDLPFDAPLAEAAGHQNAVVAGEQPLGPLALDLFALNAADADLRVVVNAGVVDRFVDRLVGVLVLGVFADDGDADLVLRDCAARAGCRRQLSRSEQAGLQAQAELLARSANRGRYRPG